MKAEMHNYSQWIDGTNHNELRGKFLNLLNESGFDVLGEIDHHFKPSGYTLLCLLGESHFAIHTFPEHNRTYIELSSCVEKPFVLFLHKMSSDECSVELLS